MNRFQLAGAALLLAAGQAMGNSFVSFELEIGGDNHAAAWHASPPFNNAALQFTQGNSADDQTFAVGQQITWGARVSAGGTQAAGNGAGSPIYGVANFVMDLAIYQGTTTNLATSAVFLSTINDGTGNPGDTTGNPPILSAASFALVYNLGNLGPGRVVDRSSGSSTPAPALFGAPLCGGVDTSTDRLKSATYPTPAPGKLVGMGGGYNAWSTAAGSGKTTQGIGMVTLPNGNAGLGVKVLAEGQINTTGMAAGTYTLTLTPGAGINVLRGDINLNTSQNAFATAADGSTGDSIKFILAPCTAPGLATNPSPADFAPSVGISPTLSWTAGLNAVSHKVYLEAANPPTVLKSTQAGISYPVSPSLNYSTTYFWRIDEVSLCGLTTTGTVWRFTTIDPPAMTVDTWRSVQAHTGIGDQSITLNKAATAGTAGSAGPTSESRDYAGVTRIQMDFSRPCALLDVPLITGSDASNPELVDYIELSDTTKELVYQLTNGVCYTIDLSGVVEATDGGPNPALGGDTNCAIRILGGDTTSNGTVNLGDVLVDKARIGEAVSPNNAAADVNMSGAIDGSDQSLTKTKMGNTCCP